MVELYRKYRPQKLEDVVGMDTTIKSLQKEMENGSHVFLFTGPAGCGKTTLARIMAKEVGAGELSIREINSSDNRGVDTAREIMGQMRFTPTDGKALVWILDEVHQMTSQAQNAFLKPLEDTPETVYFFLCTTNPEKLIAPLKTRCSEIAVKPLSDKDMMFLLKRTARAEKRKLDDDIYERIIDLAGGGSRKALKLLGKVLYLDDKDEMITVLKAGADSEDNPETIELCRALIRKTDIKTLLGMLKKMDLGDAEKVRQAVMGYANSCLLNGHITNEVVATMQAFSSADTYKNGRFALSVAILDRDSLLN